MQQNAYDLILLIVSSYYDDDQIFKMVKLLLQSYDIKCISRLSRSIIGGNIKTTGLLIQHGANMYDNKFYDADFYVQYLISNYADEKGWSMNDSFANNCDK